MDEQAATNRKVCRFEFCQGLMMVGFLRTLVWKTYPKRRQTSVPSPAGVRTSAVMVSSPELEVRRKLVITIAL